MQKSNRTILISNAQSLTILEQARLIDELQSVQGMCCSDIALLIERSRAWVSVRTGIVKEMSCCVMDKIFSEQFPAYAYMYTLRRFMRINRVSKKDVDDFVCAVAGRNLSLRDIDILANGYFKGSDELRGQIQNGDIAWGLEELKASSVGTTNSTQPEQNMLKDLSITQKYMQRVASKSSDMRFKSASFKAQADLLSGGILRQLHVFEKAVRELHDRFGLDKRQAIYSFYKEGMGAREISRRMNIAVNTASAIIKQEGRMPEGVREDKISTGVCS